MRTRAIRGADRVRTAVEALAVGTFLCAGIAACDQDPVAPPPITFPLTNVSFNGHVKPLFLNNCAVSGCHDGPREENRWVGLESYAQVLSSGVVSPTLPERSRLTLVLRGSLLHPSDPLFQAISLDQREGIIQWIREGALDN